MDNAIEVVFILSGEDGKTTLSTDKIVTQGLLFRGHHLAVIVGSREDFIYLRHFTCQVPFKGVVGLGKDFRGQSRHFVKRDAECKSALREVAPVSLELNGSDKGITCGLTKACKLWCKVDNRFIAMHPHSFSGGEVGVERFQLRSIVKPVSFLVVVTEDEESLSTSGRVVPSLVNTNSPSVDIGHNELEAVSLHIRLSLGRGEVFILDIHRFIIGDSEIVAVEEVKDFDVPLTEYYLESSLEVTPPSGQWSSKVVLKEIVHGVTSYSAVIM